MGYHQTQIDFYLHNSTLHTLLGSTVIIFIILLLYIMGVLQDRFKCSNLVEIVFIEARIIFLKKLDFVLKIIFTE